MKKLLILAVTVLLAGCSVIAAIDKSATTFEPMTIEGAPGFKYMGFSDNIYPLDSEAAEQQRMDWLNEWLSDNSYCQGGYKITSRTPVKQTWATHYIYYQGVCL